MLPALLLACGRSQPATLHAEPDDRPPIVVASSVPVPTRVRSLLPTHPPVSVSARPTTPVPRASPPTVPTARVTIDSRPTATIIVVNSASYPVNTYLADHWIRVEPHHSVGPMKIYVQPSKQTGPEPTGWNTVLIGRRFDYPTCGMSDTDHVLPGHHYRLTIDNHEKTCTPPGVKGAIDAPWITLSELVG